MIFLLDFTIIQLFLSCQPRFWGVFTTAPTVGRNLDYEWDSTCASLKTSVQGLAHIIIRESHAAGIRGPIATYQLTT